MNKPTVTMYLIT